MPQQNALVNRRKEGRKAIDPLLFSSLRRPLLPLFPSHFSDLISGQYRRSATSTCASASPRSREIVVIEQGGDRWAKVEGDRKETTLTTEGL